MTALAFIPQAAWLLLMAALAACAVGCWVLKRQREAGKKQLVNIVIDMCVVGILAARLAFVSYGWRDYMGEPLAILYLGDGGYVFWVGVIAGLAFGLWRVRRRPKIWYALGSAVVAGWAVWVLAGAMWALTQRADTAVPNIAMQRVDGQQVHLKTMTHQPMVINLWATWCPPCRREMPMLAKAQQRYSGVTFVFANQRQGSAAVSKYLDDEGLDLENVLLDSGGDLALSAGSQALPTTLFLDEKGRVLDTHVGILSSAGLTHMLKKFEMIEAKR